MSRPWHHALNFAAAAGLLLAVAASVLMVRSHWVAYSLVNVRFDPERLTSRVLEIRADNGQFLLESRERSFLSATDYAAVHARSRSRPAWYWRTYQPPDSSPFIAGLTDDTGMFGFDYQSGMKWGDRVTRALVPIWAAVVPGASVVLFWAWRRERKRRYRRPDQCAACGYDLTGNVSGVCPECGTPVQPAPAAHPRG